jgi:hypothetical protein
MWNYEVVALTTRKGRFDHKTFVLVVVLTTRLSCGCLDRNIILVVARTTRLRLPTAMVAPALCLSRFLKACDLGGLRLCVDAPDRCLGAIFSSDNRGDKNLA